MEFKVKALNPDSEAEVLDLCSLYIRSYGKQFSLTPVHDVRFWKARAGNRFTTLLVRTDNKLVASVSLRPDRDRKERIQLYLAVCDPEFLPRAAEIRTVIADLLHRLALRQKWEMLYSYQFLQIPQQAGFSHYLVNGTDVALWPASLPSGSKRAGAHGDFSGLGSVLISQRVLAVEPASASDQKSVLFVPSEHLELCSSLYQRLGLSFVISGDVEQASKQLSESLALSADRRAIERQTHRQGGFSLCFVEPSLALSFKTLEEVLSRNARCADYVALNMLDPKTPEFAEQLKNIGFGLGGVLPFHRNRHTLLYYRTTEPFDWSSLAQDSSLIRYLRTANAEAATQMPSRRNKKSNVNSARG